MTTGNGGLEPLIRSLDDAVPPDPWDRHRRRRPATRRPGPAGARCTPRCTLRGSAGPARRDPLGVDRRVTITATAPVGAKISRAGVHSCGLRRPCPCVRQSRRLVAVAGYVDVEEPRDVDAAAAPAGAAAGAWGRKVRKVYDEVSGPLWRSLVATYGSTFVADDAVAEGFARLLRRSDVTDPAAWVWQVSLHVAADLDERSRAAGFPAVGTGFDDNASVLRGRDDELPDAAIGLIEALSRLGEQQRRCVALVDIAGLTAPQAAAILGTTAATVRAQLRTARRTLRGLLRDGDRSSWGDSARSRCRAGPQAQREPEELLG